MSGTVNDNIFGSSGSIIAAAGGLSWQSVVTASTVTVSAGKGYFIDTTSNACTITLPSSAEAGDQIILADYARTWGTNAITIDSNGLLFQGETDAFIVDYDTAGQAINLVYSGSTVGWTPASDIVSAFEPVQPPTQKAIFGYGNASDAPVSMTNLVNSSGVVASDVTGVGTARDYLAASSYGGDKVIFGYGTASGGGKVSLTNLVNNSGVVATDVTGVGTARSALEAASYGGDKAIFGYGTTGSNVSLTNLVNNSGVVAADVTGVGTARSNLGAAGYGGDKAIFGYGESPRTSITNLVSNTGIVASDTTGVGTAKYAVGSAEYGGDKAIFGYGNSAASDFVSTTNLVSNVGIVSADVSGVGSARNNLKATSYGGDKAIFGYGVTSGGRVSITNLVNSSGVVASDTTGVGTARNSLAAAGFSFSA
jgi:hypothetical protein